MFIHVVCVGFLKHMFVFIFRPCDEDIDINIIDKSANNHYYSTVPGELGNHTTIH